MTNVCPLRFREIMPVYLVMDCLHLQGIAHTTDDQWEVDGAELHNVRSCTPMSAACCCRPDCGPLFPQGAWLPNMVSVMHCSIGLLQ